MSTYQLATAEQLYIGKKGKFSGSLNVFGTREEWKDRMQMPDFKALYFEHTRQCVQEDDEPVPFDKWVEQRLNWDLEEIKLSKSSEGQDYFIDEENSQRMITRIQNSEIYTTNTKETVLLRTIARVYMQKGCGPNVTFICEVNDGLSGLNNLIPPIKHVVTQYFNTVEEAEECLKEVNRRWKLSKL
jgi:hypothetical protein